MADQLDELLLGVTKPQLEAVEKARAERFRSRILDRHKGRVEAPVTLKALHHVPDSIGHNHLVIGDAHAHPDHPNWRFEWLGKMIEDLRPDVVVDIGDWFDMPSLFGFERAGGAKDLGRYWRDIEAGIDARERVDWALRKSRRRYKPRLISTTGNHEERIKRVCEAIPAVRGTWDYTNFEDALFGWERQEFGEPIEIDGFHYVHTPFGTGKLGYGGPFYQCANAIKGTTTSLAGRNSVFGHSHRQGLFRFGRQMSVCAGHFADYTMDWLPAAKQAMWWSGITLLKGVRDGQADVEFVSIDRVRARYA